MSGAAARPLLAILMLLAGGSLALGQAGSTGGTIGKTDKSVSGETAPEKQTQTKSRSKGQGPIDKEDQPSSKQNLVTAVIGSWNWEGSCESGGSWQGGIILEPASGNNFTGRFDKGTSAPSSGPSMETASPLTEAFTG